MLFKPTKRVKFSSEKLYAQSMTLKSASDPFHKRTFNLFRERELPWSTQSRHLSSMLNTSLKEENDYDSDVE